MKIMACKVKILFRPQKGKEQDKAKSLNSRERVGVCKEKRHGGSKDGF